MHGLEVGSNGEEKGRRLTWCNNGHKENEDA